MKEFEKLGIEGLLLKSIENEGFETPTEIQAKSIPLILAGKDVIGCSETGSGKTLAFGSGIIQHSDKDKGLQVLVLTPTRELAEQVAKSLRIFSKYKLLNIAAIYGGVPIGYQIRDLKSVNVVVGTPGRILDHIERKTIVLNNIHTLVLDEADIMFDMGFVKDVEKIIKNCSVKRQTLLFSATFSPQVYHIVKKHMRDPIQVGAETQVDPKKLTQVYYDVQDTLKFSMLVHLLRNENSGLVMVFCNSRRITDIVANNLKLEKMDALAIHGGLSQEKRTSIMKHFNSQKTFVLVCTDVASRGLDIPGVSHVYNYDIPKDSKQYVHRIGRTARAGKEGKAINILAGNDHDNFSRVLKEIRVHITKEVTPYLNRINLVSKTRRNFRESSQRQYGTQSSYRGQRRSNDSHGPSGFRRKRYSA